MAKNATFKRGTWHKISGSITKTVITFELADQLLSYFGIKSLDSKPSLVYIQILNQIIRFGHSNTFHTK